MFKETNSSFVDMKSHPFEDAWLFIAEMGQVNNADSSEKCCSWEFKEPMIGLKSFEILNYGEDNKCYFGIWLNKGHTIS